MICEVQEEKTKKHQNSYTYPLMKRAEKLQMRNNKPVAHYKFSVQLSTEGANRARV